MPAPFLLLRVLHGFIRFGRRTQTLDDFEVLMNDVVVVTGLRWRICRPGSSSRGVLVLAAAGSSGSIVLFRQGTSARRTALWRGGGKPSPYFRLTGCPSGPSTGCPSGPSSSCAVDFLALDFPRPRPRPRLPAPAASPAPSKNPAASSPAALVGSCTIETGWNVMRCEDLANGT